MQQRNQPARVSEEELARARNAQVAELKSLEKNKDDEWKTFDDPLLMNQRHRYTKLHQAGCFQQVSSQMIIASDMVKRKQTNSSAGFIKLWNSYSSSSCPYGSADGEAQILDDVSPGIWNIFYRLDEDCAGKVLGDIVLVHNDVYAKDVNFERRLDTEYKWYQQAQPLDASSTFITVYDKEYYLRETEMNVSSSISPLSSSSSTSSSLSNVEAKLIWNKMCDRLLLASNSNFSMLQHGIILRAPLFSLQKGRNSDGTSVYVSTVTLKEKTVMIKLDFAGDFNLMNS